MKLSLYLAIHHQLILGLSSLPETEGKEGESERGKRDVVLRWIDTPDLTGRLFLTVSLSGLLKQTQAYRRKFGQSLRVRDRLSSGCKGRGRAEQLGLI